MSGFEGAVEKLRTHGIRFEFRRGRTDADPLPSEGELDVEMSNASADRADAPLRSAGFHPFRAPGHEGHRFWLALDEGRWLKLDAKLSDGPASGRGGLASARRAGPIVAFLGPDGAGKGTIVQGLAERMPVGVRIVYLGMDRRHGPEPAGAPEAEGEGDRRHGAPRELLGLAYRVARAWAMIAPAYASAWRGHVVLCDRHPIEVLAVRPERTRAGETFERFAARHLLPWPDAIVVLDAPAETLFARKGEHGVPVLERWRRGYREVFGDRAALISTTGAEDTARRTASEVVWGALASRRRWRDA